MKQLILIAVIALAEYGDAHAQSGTTQTVKLPVARRLYDEGVDASDKGQWSIAYDRFKASYDLVPRMHTLFNLAVAQSQTGRLVEASESYRRFLRETSGTHFELRTQASNQLELIEKQLAQVVLDVVNIEPGDLIAIDAVELPHAALRQSIPMNPGPHVARVQRETSVIATRAITLASGAVESVRIELPARKPILELPLRGSDRDSPPRKPVIEASEHVRPDATGSRPGPSTPERGRSWLRSPWLWSGVAIVIAGGAAGSYLLTRPDGVVIH